MIWDRQEWVWITGAKQRAAGNVNVGDQTIDN